MPNALHAIVTSEGEDYGLSLTSPQLPGFVAAYEDRSTLLRNYKTDIQQAGFRTGQVWSHWQVRGATAAGHEYVVRWATDSESEERTEAGRRAVAMLEGSEGEGFLAGNEPDAAGVITFLCCIATDTLGWIAEQLDERGDVVVLVASIAQDLVFATSLATDGARDWPSLAAQGLSLDTTVAELMSMGARRPERLSV